MINSFKLLLQEETWDSVYNTNNISEKFSNFHNILVRNFENSFPFISVGNKQKSNNWITNGIKISYRKKRELYLIRRNSSKPQVINYYNRYDSVLRK
jgi:hypothetical protein